MAVYAINEATAKKIEFASGKSSLATLFTMAFAPKGKTMVLMPPIKGMTDSVTQYLTN